MRPSAARVARRFLARDTQNTQRLEAAFKEWEEVFHSLSSLVSRPWEGDSWRLTPEQRAERLKARQDQAVKTVPPAAEKLLLVLDIEFEDEDKAKALKKYLTRIKNFRKMIESFAAANTWEELKAAVEKHSPKGREEGVWRKYYEYREEMLNLLRHADEEVVGSFTHEGWKIDLMNAVYGGDDEWDLSKLDKAKGLLSRVNRILTQAGMGIALGGHIFVYPTKTLPSSVRASSHSVVARYQPKTDLCWLAVGHPDFRQAVSYMVHELGHRVWFKVMSGGARQAFREFYESNKAVPDVDALIKEWQAFVANPSSMKDGPRDPSRQALLAPYYPWFYNHLRATGKDEMADLLALIEMNYRLRSGEVMDPLTERPKPNSVSGLDKLIEKKSEIKLFTMPVTVYSTVSAEELFAETFTNILTYGPQRVPGRLLGEFQRAIPKLRF